MAWYQEEGSPQKYDEHFDNWLPRTQRQAKNPWPYKIVMAKKTKGLVLDAGCGYGCISRFIGNGVFLDFSRVALKKRWVGGNRTRLLASVEDMPFMDEVFDSVIAPEVIEHVDSPKKLVREVYRILKRGGLFTFSFPWTDASPTHKWKKITKEMIHEWINPPFTQHSFDVPPLRKERGMVYAYK